MNTATVRIKGIDGVLSPEKPCYTDILNLRKGDIVLVFRDIGVELAVFEEYSRRRIDTLGFIIDKVSGDRIEKRLKEQRELFVLELSEPEEVLKLEDIYNDKVKEVIKEEKPKEKLINTEKRVYTIDEIWGNKSLLSEDDEVGEGDLENEELKDFYDLELNDDECEFMGLECEYKEIKEDEDLMDSESLIEKFTKKLKEYEEVEDRYEKYVNYVEERGLEPVDFYIFEEYFY
jgi:hypothetical protein